MTLRPGETGGRPHRAGQGRPPPRPPLGRLSAGASAAAEVAAAVLYLAADDAASVVGTGLVVVGGAAR
ncbi:hypothetical protein [Streptomyces sp. NPDC058964]|uniref:hypothetical protein n=1 Tax=Streptomyces sp. NPDC058964 TaxID=3346681 RepID=UPI0036BB0A85